MFTVLFSIVITSLGEGRERERERGREGERESWSICFSCIWLVYFARINFCQFSVPLGVSGLIAVWDCGTPWTFLLLFVYNFSKFHFSRIPCSGTPGQVFNFDLFVLASPLMSDHG